MKRIYLLVFITICNFFRSDTASLDSDHDSERVLKGKPLSEHEHNDYNDHEYDHEAFLGDEAHDFDDLSPEESQRRLGEIVNKIDSDSDGFVSVEELQQWIKFTQSRYVSEDTEKQWTVHKSDDKDTINWSEYRQGVYGFLDEEDMDQEEAGFSYKKMEERDQRRWNLADVNKDGELTREEFSTFLHPEDADHMRDIVITETLEDIDKDGDGRINLEEYIGDMYREGEEGSEEPDWGLQERNNFQEFRDRDGDGFMDMEEVRAWIVPPDYDHSEAEAKHLVFEADEDHDNLLTREEILDKYDIFVGSQATDFGEALTRHDEF